MQTKWVVILKQMSNYMDAFFSKQQCGFRKSYNTQYLLSVMHTRKMETAFGKEKYFKALLRDLSEALDCISHKMFLAKLHVMDLI